MVYVGMNEILDYIDNQYGYGTNDDVVDYMKSIPNESKDKHLIVRKTFFKYLNDYVQRKYQPEERSNTTYLKYIRNNDKGTKGAKYDFEQIKEFLADEVIQEKLKEQLEKKTTLIGEIRIPDCVLHNFVEDIDDYSITGYTTHQLKIMSVPDELLTERRESLKIKYEKLKKQLHLLGTELADIQQELNNRQSYH